MSYNHSRRNEWVPDGAQGKDVGHVVCSYALKCYIGRDGRASSDASSSHPWWKTSRVWWGGVIGAMLQGNCVSSEMG